MFIDGDRDFYHLAGQLLEIGSVIKAGSFGRIVLRAGWAHGSAMRETILEEARERVQPKAPSRYECNFCFLTAETATWFRDNTAGFHFRPLYRVRLLDIKAPTFLADYCRANPADRSPDPSWPKDYWVNAYVHPEFFHCEVLTSSDFVIDEFIE